MVFDTPRTGLGAEMFESAVIARRNATHSDVAIRSSLRFKLQFTFFLPILDFRQLPIVHPMIFCYNKEKKYFIGCVGCEIWNLECDGAKGELRKCIGWQRLLSSVRHGFGQPGYPLRQ